MSNPQKLRVDVQSSAKNGLYGGIEQGSEVTLHYDPMLAKLIVHAPTRDLAISRMHRALLELTIDGVETSRSFHLRVLEHPDFQRGDISIQWLEQTLPELTHVKPTRESIRVAAIAGHLLAMQFVGFLGKLLGVPIGGDINGFEIGFTLSSGGVAVVLLLFILARVFRIGAEMRDELEGTV